MLVSVNRSGIGAELVDQVQRVDDVALGLGHLGALFVAHQPVDIDRVERHLVHDRKLHHHHPGDPEKDDVEARDQNVGREIPLHFLVSCGQPSVPMGHRPELNHVSSTSGSRQTG